MSWHRSFRRSLNCRSPPQHSGLQNFMEGCTSRRQATACSAVDYISPGRVWLITSARQEVSSGPSLLYRCSRPWNRASVAVSRVSVTMVNVPRRFMQARAPGSSDLDPVPYIPLLPLVHPRRVAAHIPPVYNRTPKYCGNRSI